MPTETALLVIDLQESFRRRPDDWATQSTPDVIDRVDALVEHARRGGDTVVWVTHAEPGTGGVFDPESGFVRVVDELVPRAGEPQLTKTTVNAFTSTDLEDVLRSRGVSRVVVCGIRTEQCCETTARIAADLGFAVDFVTDATSTSPIAAGEGYAEVSGEEIMRRTESVLAARGFARIVTTAERIAG